MKDKDLAPFQWQGDEVRILSEQSPISRWLAGQGVAQVVTSFEVGSSESV
jgi:hypothetical protein